MDPSLIERAARIKLLLMDVDGVLTDGVIYHIPDGSGGWTETKGFDSQDGIALQWLHWHGIQTGIISGRKSAVVDMRAKQGHMSYCYQGHIEKIPILREIVEHSGLNPKQIAFIGDDFTDIVVMRRVGLGIAVANARPEVKQIAHITTKAVGGAGAVREAAVLLLQAQGHWNEILTKYEIEHGG